MYGYRLHRLCDKTNLPIWWVFPFGGENKNINKIKSKKKKKKNKKSQKDKTKRDKTKQIKQNKLQGSKNAKDEDKIQDNGTEAAVDRAACVSCWVIVVGIR